MAATSVNQLGASLKIATGGGKSLAAEFPMSFCCGKSILSAGLHFLPTGAPPNKMREKQFALSVCVFNQLNDGGQFKMLFGILGSIRYLKIQKS